jgi:hypothetical protein
VDQHASKAILVFLAQYSHFANPAPTNVKAVTRQQLAKHALLDTTFQPDHAWLHQAVE